MVAFIINAVFGFLTSLAGILLAPVNLLFSAIPGLNLVAPALEWLIDMVDGFLGIGLATLGIAPDVWNTAVVLVPTTMLTISISVKLVKTITRLLRGM